MRTPRDRGGDVAGERYPMQHAGPVRLGDALVASGQPLQLMAFSTGDSPPRVIAFYEEAFRNRGLVPLSRATPRLGHVSAFDPRDGLQRVVTAFAGRPGDTLVLVGAADPAHAPQLARPFRDAPYPVPEGSRAFLASGSDDDGVHTDTGQFVTASRADAVLAFYRDRLGRQGYLDTSAGAPGALATFTKVGGEVVTVAVQALEPQRASAVFVSRTRPR
jgi:hypothetical protein